MLERTIPRAAAPLPVDLAAIRSRLAVGAQLKAKLRPWEAQDYFDACALFDQLEAERREHAATRAELDRLRPSFALSYKPMETSCKKQLP